MSPDSQAAEIELLFLRGVLPREIDVPREPIRVAARPDAMRRADEPRELSFADAVAHLVAQAKPVRCRGRLWHRILSISVGAPTAEQLQFHNWMLALPPSKASQPPGAAKDDPVLIKSGNESVIVSLEAFDHWQRDYVRSGSTMVGRPQTIEDASPGERRFELVIGETRPVEESYALHEDESVLCDRCRQQLAVAVFRDRTTTPPTTSLLCEDCLRAETGREFARTLGVEKTLSDEESRQLLDNMFESMRKDPHDFATDDESKE